MKLTIYWVTKDESIRARIRKRFGIPLGHDRQQGNSGRNTGRGHGIAPRGGTEGFIQIRFKKSMKH